MTPSLDRTTLATCRRIVANLRFACDQPLTISQIEVLLFIYEQSRLVTRVQISDALDMTHQAVLSAVRQLHKLRLITKDTVQRELCIGTTSFGNEILGRALRRDII